MPEHLRVSTSSLPPYFDLFLTHSIILSIKCRRWRDCASCGRTLHCRWLRLGFPSWIQLTWYIGSSLPWLSHAVTLPWLCHWFESFTAFSIWPRWQAVHLGSWHRANRPMCCTLTLGSQWVAQNVIHVTVVYLSWIRIDMLFRQEMAGSLIWGVW
jgi:hypothetical protein